MAHNHPFDDDLPANQQLQQVLNFVASKKNIHGHRYKTPCISPIESFVPEHHPAVSEAEPSASDTSTSTQLHDESVSIASHEFDDHDSVSDSPTTSSLCQKDLAATTTMAPKRKSDIEEFEKSTKPYFRDELVTITLDGSSTSYKVSKALLCNASPYFVKALDGPFQEGRDHKLRLPGCNLETFKLFVGYLAHGRLPEFEAESERLYADDVSAIQQELICLWCFADAHIMPKLQNEAMRAVLAVNRYWYLTKEESKLAFETSTEGSAIRKMIIDHAAFDWISVPRPGYLNQEWCSYMGKIDGFFFEYLKRASPCGKKDCDHDNNCQNLDIDDHDQYMVPET